MVVCPRDGFSCEVREIGGADLSSFVMVSRGSWVVYRTKDVRAPVVGVSRAVVLPIILPLLEHSYPFFCWI